MASFQNYLKKSVISHTGYKIIEEYEKYGALAESFTHYLLQKC